MGFFKKSKPGEQEPLEARLEVGDKIRSQKGLHHDISITYTGMVNTEVFSLNIRQNFGGTAANYYFPASRKSITLQTVSLEILDVTSEYIHLRYERVK